MCPISTQIFNLECHQPLLSSLTVDLCDFPSRFLRPAKFNEERASKMIKRYYRMRADAPSIFTNRYTPRDQIPSFRFNLSTVLPHKDALGRTLFLVRPGAWEPRKLCKDDFFMSVLLMMELSIRDVQTLIKGEGVPSPIVLSFE